MAAKTQAAEPGKAPGMAAQLIVLVMMTLLAGGAGWGVSKYLDGLAAKTEATEVANGGDVAGKEQNEGGHGEAKKEAGDHGEGESTTTEDEKADRITELTSVDLTPIVTNLAAPADTWIRLELTVQFNGAPAEDLVQQIDQDLLAFVRTVNLEQVSGPSGYLHLKSDLTDIAAIRSEGLAKAVLIRVMLFE